MPDLFTLLYRSHSVRVLDAHDLLRLLMISLRNNARDGITGVLLYGPKESLPNAEADLTMLTSVVPFDGPGAFVQWLEGPEDAVRALYFDRIAHDTRHTDLVLLGTGTSTHRLFPHWAMALEPSGALPSSADAIARLAAARHQPTP
ncbi:MAG: BLUF domain-containing protein [Rhodothermales bacterium]